MRNFPAQVGPGGEPVSDQASLTSSNANDIIQEEQNAIASSGQTLIPIGDPADNTQLSQAMSRYASGGIFGVDSGAADAYVISATGSFTPPDAYFDGMIINFRAGNDNTTASTVNAFGIGVVDLVQENGSALSANFITTLVDTTARYDLASGDFFVVSAAGSGGGVPSGTLLSTQQFAAGGTWNKPAGVNKVLVYVTGGGGGGGGGVATDDGAAGGGAGGTAIEFIDVTGTSSETVTIGAGGAGGATTVPGVAGGTSSFGAFCSATGGGGGGTGTSGPGGTGGVGTGGDVNISGQGGVGGDSINLTAGGAGGSSYFGGGAPGEVTAVGASSGNYGGGGAGGSDANSGGAGADGFVWVLEYS